MTDEQTLARELRAGLDQINSGRAATLALVADLDDRDAHRIPERGGWSVANVLDHLLKTDEVYRAQFSRAFELQAAGRPPVIDVSLAELNTRPVGVPAALMSYLELPFRLMNRILPAFIREYLTGVAIIPFRTPDVARPGSEEGIEALRDRFRDSAGEIEALLSGRSLSGVILEHALLGRNTVPRLLRILARHEDRHRGQISRVLSEMKRATAAKGASDPAGTAKERLPRGPRSGSADARLRAFADDVDDSLSTGRQIADWWREKALADALDLFPLRPAYPPYYEMQGFFDSILLLGDMEPTSIMGCLQRHRFKRRLPAVEGAAAHLESFIDELFLARCYRPRPDGSPGGFRYRPVCLKEKDGRLLEAPDPEAIGADLASFRNGREWAVLRVDILDFVRANPVLARYDDTLSRFIRESAYIAVHEDLALEITKAPAGVMAERRFGYAFLGRPVERNIFGFGPGKFGAAIKQWRFLLFRNGDVEVQVAFLVAPRSQKVLDIAGFDPIYSSVAVADAFSFGALGLRSSAHAALDAVFLEHHGSVHAGVVMGLRDVWEGQRWMPSFGSW